MDPGVSTPGRGGGSTAREQRNGMGMSLDTAAQIQMEWPKRGWRLPIWDIPCHAQQT